MVSGRESLFSPTDIFLDKAWRSLAVKAKSYIPDTTDFLKQIQTLIIPEGALLASFDVISLYKAINHEKGLRGVYKALCGSTFSEEIPEFIRAPHLDRWGGDPPRLFCFFEYC